jgi:hypothetical protein
MLGFRFPKERAEKQGFLEGYVKEKSRETLSSAYWNAMKRMAASTIQLTCMKKNGATIDSMMILVPMFFQGHMLSVHFITNVDYRQLCFAGSIDPPSIHGWRELVGC